MTHKTIKLVTNYKTNKQHVEYRIFSNNDTFKTISPKKWEHVCLEDKTSDTDKYYANQFLVRDFIKGNMRLGIELNELIKTYVSQCLSKYDAYYSFAKKHGIKQY